MNTPMNLQKRAIIYLLSKLEYNSSSSYVYLKKMHNYSKHIKQMLNHLFCTVEFQEQNSLRILSTTAVSASLPIPKKPKKCYDIVTFRNIFVQNFANFLNYRNFFLTIFNYEYSIKTYKQWVYRNISEFNIFQKNVTIS